MHSQIIYLSYTKINRALKSSLPKRWATRWQHQEFFHVFSLLLYEKKLGSLAVEENPYIRSTWISVYVPKKIRNYLSRERFPRSRGSRSWRWRKDSWLYAPKSFPPICLSFWVIVNKLCYKKIKNQMTNAKNTNQPHPNQHPDSSLTGLNDRVGDCNLWRRGFLSPKKCKTAAKHAEKERLTDQNEEVTIRIESMVEGR